MDAVQLDLFAELEPKKAWLFEGMASEKNDCEVFTENVIELKKGSYKSFSVELSIAAYRNHIFYDFGFESAMDSHYSSFSPLNEQSPQCHRNNSIEFLQTCILGSFKQRLNNNRNLCNKSRTEIYKLMEKLVKEVA